MATSEDGLAMAEDESTVDLMVDLSQEIDNGGELYTYSWFHLHYKLRQGTLRYWLRIWRHSCFSGWEILTSETKFYDSVLVSEL